MTVFSCLLWYNYVHVATDIKLKTEVLYNDSGGLKKMSTHREYLRFYSIPDIYSIELQNKANTSDKETSFLDLVVLQNLVSKHMWKSI